MIDAPETKTEQDAAPTFEIEAEPGRVWGTWPPPNTAPAGQPKREPKTMVRVIVIDDQQSALRNLRWELRLEPNLEVVGEALTGADGIALAQECHPDIVVMDLEMPVMDGVQATELLHTLAPDCLIMLLTVRYNWDMHERARAAGARVVVDKLNPSIFRHAFHDLVQYVRARNVPAWPESDAVHTP
jgi:CheY-like chemotaxis protein